MAKWQMSMALFSLLAVPLASRGERLYRKMPGLPVDAQAGPLPSLSIIVPARNEARNLERLLPSLTAIRYPGGWELIVVDDSSTDETAAIAAAHGARVVPAPPLPPGWLGKPHACQQGAAVASGEWLLFIDADTVHAPHGPASAVAFARQHELDGLTLLLKQETESWPEQAALLAAHAGLFAGLPTLDGLMYGQYILLHRSAYEVSGGFAGVRHEPLEDLALGHHLCRHGYRVPALRGETAGRVYMYNTFTHLWTGLVRLGAGALPWSGRGAPITALFTGAAATPVLALAASLFSRQARWSTLAAWLAVTAGFIPWARHFGPARIVLLAPAGAFLVMVAAIWGLLRRLSGRDVSWKGRLV